jgi:RNA polymerase sigma-70 factor (ECF subfamily)
LFHRTSPPATTQNPVTTRALTSSAVAADAAAGLCVREAALDFEAVYAEHARFVWRSLARLGVPEEQIADGLQDVFVVVHRRLSSFEGRSSIRTWLFGITLRVASDLARRARRHPSEPLVESLADTRGEAPFDSAARSEAVSTLHRILDELSPEQRATFILIELEQMSVPEAAVALEANIHTVTSRLKVARQRFEAALRRHRASDRRSHP